MMKKTLLAFGIASMVSVSYVQAQTYFTENFDAAVNPALPASWVSTPTGQWQTGLPATLIPNAITGLNLTAASLNVAAHTKSMGIDGSLATSNGAIIASPSVTIPAGATNAAVFFDKCYFGVRLNSDATKKETLTFVVSTDGGATWTDVKTITSGSTIWAADGVNIGTYAGQTIKFGFRYQNTGAALVGVVFDNVKVWTNPDMAMVSSIGGDHPHNGSGYQLVGTNATITGTVQNTGTSIVTGYTVKYRQGSGAVQTYTKTGVTLNPYQTDNFTHSVPFAVAAQTPYPMAVWVELTSDAVHTNDTANITVTGASFLPNKKLTFEEGTGTWCGWCPRGAVYMENFAEANPGKAAQIAVHNSDPMTVSAYDSYMSSYVSGFPNLVIDRVATADPSDIDDAYTAWKDNFGFAEFTMGTPVVTSGTVSVPVTIKPAITINNPKLALVVTESNVTGTGTNWPQHNYYAGGGSGTMGGWETQGSTVSNVNFHFVARSISAPGGSVISSLPTTLVANTTYDATLTGTVNSAWKPADLQYLALFIKDDATVMNSAYSALPTLKPGLPTAITNVAAGIDKAELYPNPTAANVYLDVTVKDAASATLTVTDATGRTVVAPVAKQLHTGNNVLNIETSSLSNGLYFVNLATAKGTVSLKLQVAK